MRTGWGHCFEKFESSYFFNVVKSKHYFDGARLSSRGVSERSFAFGLTQFVNGSATGYYAGGNGRAYVRVASGDSGLAGSVGC